ncbi:hypothetical protein [Petropleomorpha daqingensis]|uniref:Antibiotic biosynthesis monooxygenase n=1 Tax=Petropleomorpha daqingensis TaxID=2026353 RepID=A0A853CMB7_9ACTN|nr:hypothetical protein [Petropleomorpha daqingensis]NYJ08576.1 hypothetical protein [Petropleomorpha daqingensis]
MFAQVIQGRTSDLEGIKRASDRWVAELAPGATGWLGSTAGTTDDGRFVVVARFESAEAARRNSDRPEQGRWWEETSRSLEDVTFMDSEDVLVELAGDPAQAGFVQVMQGRVTDADRARKIMAELPPDLMAKYRPDVLGSVMIGAPDGRWTQVVYFTSEEEARAAEGQEPPAEFAEAMQEMGSLSVGETQFFDLRRPVLHSPR